VTGLIRIIILGMLIALARNLFLKFQQNRQKLSTKNRSDKNQTSTEKNIEPKKTVRCDHCGIYIPVNEALQDGEKNYCCPEHQELDQ